MASTLLVYGSVVVGEGVSRTESGMRHRRDQNKEGDVNNVVYAPKQAISLVVCDGSGAIMLLCAVAAVEGDNDALGVVYCSGGRR